MPALVVGIPIGVVVSRTFTRRQVAVLAPVAASGLLVLQFFTTHFWQSVVLAVVGAAVVIPTIHRSSPQPVTRIGMGGTVPEPVPHDIVVAAERAGTAVVLVAEPSRSRARAALRAGRVALVVDGGDRVLVETAKEGSGSTTVGALAHAVASVLGVAHAFAAANLTPAQVATVTGAKPVPVQSLEPAAAQNGAARSTSVIGLVLVFVMLTQYLTWTLMGVLEEKTSRVVEVLLATVRPIQLLGGKVLGIGLVALSQAGLVVAFALVLARAVGSDLLHGTAPLVVVATLVWLVLGYAFYSWVYAAAGSVSSRQDEVQSLALPLSVPIIAGYIVGLVSASQPSPSLLVTVFAYLPPTRALRHARAGRLRRRHVVGIPRLSAVERRRHRRGGPVGSRRLPAGCAPDRAAAHHEGAHRGGALSESGTAHRKRRMSRSLRAS